MIGMNQTGFLNIFKEEYMEILLAHLFGDYVFQNRWMALNKTKNLKACLLHCFLYTMSCGLLLQLEIWQVVIVFTTHFIMDRYTLAKYWRKFFSGETDLPWIILTDNTIHLAILWLLKFIQICF